MKQDDGVKTTWPKWSPDLSRADKAALTIAGGATYLAESRGWVNGFWNKSLRPARDRAIESSYQREQRETRQALQKRNVEDDKRLREGGSAA